MATETSILESLDVRMARLEGALPFLATKEDISDLRGEMRSEISAQGSKTSGEIGALAGRVDGEIGKLRKEMGELRGEIGELRGEIGQNRVEIKSLRWTMTWTVSLMGVGLGVLMFVLR